MRKWERKYALTTEYLLKGGYGWLIKKATKAAYDAPLPVTAVVMDKVPAGMEKALLAAQGRVFERMRCSSWFPATTGSSTTSRLSPRRAPASSEIAGNGKDASILVTALVPRDWDASRYKLLFEQPVLTRPAIKRVAPVVPVSELAPLLNRLAADGARLEHVYDY